MDNEKHPLSTLNTEGVFFIIHYPLSIIHYPLSIIHPSIFVVVRMDILCLCLSNLT
jgi:hypothetical protein